MLHVTDHFLMQMMQESMHSLYLFIVPAGWCRPTTSANVCKNNNNNENYIVFLIQ